MSFRIIFEKINTSKFDERDKILDQAWINKISLPKQGISYDEANLKLRAINLTTYEEYQSVAYVSHYYIPKFQEWISKKDYEVTEIPNGEIELLINEFFHFYLTKICQSDIDAMKNEIVKLRKETYEMQKSFKLFRSYFFEQWNDSIRKSVNKDNELKHQLWETTDHLYEEAVASGFIFQEYGSLTNNLFISTDFTKKEVEEESKIQSRSKSWEQRSTIKKIIDVTNRLKESQENDIINDNINYYKQHRKRRVLDVYIDGEDIYWETSKISLTKKNINEFGEIRSLVVKIDKHINPGKKYKIMLPKTF